VPEGLRRRAALKDGSEIENRQYHEKVNGPALNLPFLASSMVGPPFHGFARV
jgi:hypothetical protein